MRERGVTFALGEDIHGERSYSSGDWFLKSENGEMFSFNKKSQHLAFTVD